MDWEEALRLIKQKVKKDTDINTERSRKNRYRVIKDHPDSEGYRVRIGRKVKIPVSWDMLQTCYKPIANGEYYGIGYFRDNFQREYKSHGCYVHVIGQIFVRAGLAEQKGNKYFNSKS